MQFAHNCAGKEQSMASKSSADNTFFSERKFIIYSGRVVQNTQCFSGLVSSLMSCRKQMYKLLWVYLSLSKPNYEYLLATKGKQNVYCNFN